MVGGGTIVSGVTNFFFFHLKVTFYQVMLVCHTGQYKCVFFWGGGGGSGRTKKQHAFNFRGEVVFFFFV